MQQGLIQKTQPKRSYLGAFTLLGHEFVELKNLPAAIEAYRSAVDTNPRDYRAWYGLGQVCVFRSFRMGACILKRKLTHFCIRHTKLPRCTTTLYITSAKLQLCARTILACGVLWAVLMKRYCALPLFLVRSQSLADLIHSHVKTQTDWKSPRGHQVLPSR